MTPMGRRLLELRLAEPLLDEFGALFKGITETEIDEMMQSFRFENCVQRSELADILASYA